MRHNIVLATGLCLALDWGGATCIADTNGEFFDGDTAAAVHNDRVTPGVFRGDVRDLPRAEPSSSSEFPPRITEPPQDPDPSRKLLKRPQSPLDPLLERQQVLGAQAPLLEGTRAFNPPDLNFPGIPFQGGAPPDTVGEIGSRHYIQMTNASVVQIYDKNGLLVAGPFALDSLWAAGGSCAIGRGDPIVLYDHLADRWLMSEFATVGNHLCVYISMTNDPVAGGWFNYDFATPNFPDYPKYAVWPDAYYVSSNEIGPSAAYALDRTNMLAGNPALPLQRFTAPDLAGFGFQALIPSDLDGPPPPAGSPNLFMRHRDDEVHNAGSNDPTRDFLEIWEFSVDFAAPTNSTFTQVADVPVAEFDSDLCGLFSFFCFPQPGTFTRLDPLREVIMWRLQYRNFGTHEALVGNFVTDVTGTDRGGIRWFELRRTPPGAGAWGLFQEGTFAPDADNRWMGSIAMDRAGNIALGYSVSSTTTFPSLRYTGRLAGDAAGVMTRPEVTAVAGANFQSGTTRWGDYSSMNVDPVDGCTFWYTNEFVGNNLPNGFGIGQWTTQIVRFDFQECFDADGDGVDDDVDLCPDTAPGDPVDTSGCSDAQVDEDGDGVCDPGAVSQGQSACVGSDACLASNLSATVVVDGCDSGAANDVGADGCTINDQIAGLASSAGNTRLFRRAIHRLTRSLYRSGVITRREKGDIFECL